MGPWVGIYIDNVFAMIRGLFRPRHRHAALAVFLELLRRCHKWDDSQPVGSLWIGREELAKNLDLSISCVRTVLNTLKTHHQLTSESTKTGTHLTIINIQDYVFLKPQSDQQTGAESAINSPSTRHQSTINPPQPRLDKIRQEEKEEAPSRSARTENLTALAGLLDTIGLKHDRLEEAEKRLCYWRSFEPFGVNRPPTDSKGNDMDVRSVVEKLEATIEDLRNGNGETRGKSSGRHFDSADEQQGKFDE